MLSSHQKSDTPSVGAESDPGELRLRMQLWAWRAWCRGTPGGRWETKQYVEGFARMRQRHPEPFELRPQRRHQAGGQRTAHPLVP